jgi:hypothetical protein
VTVLLLLAFSKAFDNVRHSLLLPEKLSLYTLFYGAFIAFKKALKSLKNLENV